MALVLINGPDNAPSTAADWDKINDVFQTIGLDINSPLRVSGSNILRGSVIFFAGAWYVADADTAITGSTTPYVRLTNTSGTVTAAFVSSLSGVTFNRTWNGWYDSSLRLYLFDEIKAYSAGAVTDPVTIKNYRPSLNWSKAISRVLSAANLARLFRVDSEVTLTGSGTWTVPSGVYWIEGIIIAPGEAGQAGSAVGGNGGDAGERRYFGFAVTPGQGIPYACTSASTVFGGTTVTAGGGETGGTGGASRGGSGGGHGGRGGSPGSSGGSGTATEGGGGGGGGSATTTPPYTPGNGGSGGLGSVRIR